MKQIYCPALTGKLMSIKIQVLRKIENSRSYTDFVFVKICLSLQLQKRQIPINSGKEWYQLHGLAKPRGLT